MSLTHYFFNDYPSSLDRFFDDVFSSRAPSGPAKLTQRLSRLDIYHDDKSNTVTATFEVPGMQKEDVTIDVHNNILTVSGETQQSTDRNEEGYSLRERRYGRFSRSVSLPPGVKNEDIRANIVNGVLTVTFPRSAPEISPARIAIA
ncbi:HSP20-like chaperone [Lactifluus subvellereus]|nr:HSP20-like chaperone [Lactifluus subvellereus]